MELLYELFGNPLSVYIVLGIIGTVTAIFAYRWGIRTFRKVVPIEEDRKYYLTITRYYIALSVITALLWLPSPIDEIIRGPFSLALSTLPLLVIIRFISRKHSNFKNLNLLNIQTQEDLNKNVAQILDTKNFLTALRSTLPKGDKDEEYGLDYVPYMLKNIEERRERFRDGANKFLVTSVAVGFFFVGITVTLGYFILDDDSIGSGRQVRLVEEQLREINGKMDYLNKDLLVVSATYKKIQKEVISLEDAVSDFRKKHSDSEPLRMSKLNIDDLDALEMQLDTLMEKHSDLHVHSDNRELYGKMYGIRDEIRSLKHNSALAALNLPVAISNTRALVEAANKELGKTENRTPEVIKRLILSVVIVSFLIAILRFLTNQYKQNYNELIAADNEDLYVRKIYIALKTAGGDTEARKIVINQLLSNLRSESNKGTSDDSEKYGIVKDIIETLSKKL